MVNPFQDGFLAMKAMKEELEEASVKEIRAKSHLEQLEKIIAEKEAYSAELEKENKALDEKIASLTAQSESLDSTIQHFRDVQRSLNADLEHKQRDVAEHEHKLAAFKEANAASLKQRTDFHDAAVAKMCDKQPLLRKWLELRREEEALAKVKADAQRELEQARQELEDLEEQERKQAQDAEKYEFLSAQLEQLQARNAERSKQIDELEAQVAQRKAAKAAQIESTVSEPNSEELNYRKDEENENHDSGMDTMFNETTAATPRVVEQDGDNNKGKSATSANSALNSTIFNPHHGPTAISTPAASLCLKGLVETSKISHMMLASTQKQPTESPIVNRKFTPTRPTASMENMRASGDPAQNLMATLRRVQHTPPATEEQREKFNHEAPKFIETKGGCPSTRIQRKIVSDDEMDQVPIVNAFDPNENTGPVSRQLFLDEQAQRDSGLKNVSPSHEKTPDRLQPMEAKSNAAFSIQNLMTSPEEQQQPSSNAGRPLGFFDFSHLNFGGGTAAAPTALPGFEDIFGSPPESNANNGSGNLGGFWF